ncbi:hypothetical protein FIBSPDRAFT_1047869 [Athelia psychrophila]|uniref:Uncharacterized protein n=1 Tax=Athelia psychrophila TaxID=1759441 RepID=A0A166ENH8_9AGAM|nr:hypothetical protein FIBSPDRAFT_1047869 [Fibularhizoctonia sp. CBS 109695]
MSAGKSESVQRNHHEVVGDVTMPIYNPPTLHGNDARPTGPVHRQRRTLQGGKDEEEGRDWIKVEAARLAPNVISPGAALAAPVDAARNTAAAAALASSLPLHHANAMPRAPTAAHTPTNRRLKLPPATNSRVGPLSASTVYTPPSASATPPRASLPSALAHSHTDDTPQHVCLHGHPAAHAPSHAGTHPRLYPAAHTHSRAPASVCTPDVLALGTRTQLPSHPPPVLAPSSRTRPPPAHPTRAPSSQHHPACAILIPHHAGPTPTHAHLPLYRAESPFDGGLAGLPELEPLTRKVTLPLSRNIEIFERMGSAGREGCEEMLCRTISPLHREGKIFRRCVGFLL